MLHSVGLVAIIASVLPTALAAVTVDAVCTYAEWTTYKGKSPCEMWGDLQAKCGSGDVVVEKLDVSINDNAQYPTPKGASATPCQCNVVAYNLMGACSWCQPLVHTQNWATEAGWRSSCTSYDSSGKLPSEASSLQSEIPSWANLKINSETWSPSRAEVLADGSGDTGGLAADSTDPFGTTTFPTSTFGSDPFDDPFSSDDPFSDDPFPSGPFNGGDPFDIDREVTNTVGKAVGIAVGVIAGIWLVVWGAALAVHCVRQKNRQPWYRATAQYYQNGGRMQEITPLVQGGNPFQTPASSVPTGSFTSNTPPPPQAPYGDYGYAQPMQGYQAQPFQYGANQYQQPPGGQAYDSNLLYQGRPNP